MTPVRPRPAGWADGLPAVRRVPAERVGERLTGARRLVVLDDDPTGTQTVRDVPVLTRWDVDDIRWALRQPAPGFFVLTNTRSLTPDLAASRNRAVAEACFTAAAETGTRLAFASRSDSTLRGHFPLETDVLAEVIAEHDRPVDAVLLSPAYVDAGRLTVDGIQWMRSGEALVPVADGEFARDPTFGYRSSRLADWVAEKSGGRIPADHVTSIGLDTVRSGDPSRLVDALLAVHNGQVAVADAVVDHDLRATAIAALRAEAAGFQLLYRVGPSFVRARLGQEANPPIEDAQLAAMVDRAAHGLVVVGSHVGLTSRQLTRLRSRRPVLDIELDVDAVIDGDRADRHLADVAARASAELADRLVVMSTSRRLVRGADAGESLAIARRVSAALTRAIRAIVTARRPAFVLSKGGITSSDIATAALGIERAWVRGCLLPGIVSLWQAASGPAEGLPYIVFAGNVGDDDSLAAVVERLEPR
jgi:uncharacterized protein YgbK (DUF1537 family)